MRCRPPSTSAKRSRSAERRTVDGHVLVGTVARSHGNRGEVIVNLETDFPEERFRSGVVLQRSRAGQPQPPLSITSARWHQGRPVLLVEGVSSISEAERLAGCDLWVPDEAQQALPDGTYWHHQLIGSEVVTAEGKTVGRVTAVEGESGVSRLVVAARGGEVLLPLADDLCRVDVAARRVTVTPIDGLLDANGRWDQEDQEDTKEKTRPGAAAE